MLVDNLGERIFHGLAGPPVGEWGGEILSKWARICCQPAMRCDLGLNCSHGFFGKAKHLGVGGSGVGGAGGGDEMMRWMEFWLLFIWVSMWFCKVLESDLMFFLLLSLFSMVQLLYSLLHTSNFSKRMAGCTLRWPKRIQRKPLTLSTSRGYVEKPEYETTYCMAPVSR